MKNRKLFAIITLVAFMLTMMPLMAFAAVTSGDVDVWVDTDYNSVKVTTGTVKAYVEINGTPEDQVVVVWATVNGVLTDAVTFNDGTYYATVTEDTALNITSNQSGTYKLNARLVKKPATSTIDYEEVFNGATGFNITVDEPTFTFKATSSDVTVTPTVKVNGEGTALKGTEKDGVITYPGSIPANNGVDYYEVSLQLLQGTTKVAGQEVTIEIDKSTGNLSKTTATTNSRGVVTFKVSASKAGTYTVTVNTAKADELTMKFKFGGNAIASISGTEPTSTVATDNELKINLTAVDANGNTLTAGEAVDLLKGEDKDTFGIAYSKVPADSDIDTDVDYYDGDLFAIDKNSSGKLQLIIDQTMIDAEGSYTVKIYNTVTGAAKYISFNAADFGKAVSATIAYDAASYNLGSEVGAPVVKVVDAAGVTKDATNSKKFSFSGVGISNFSATEGSFDVTDDDKYLGQTITVNVIVDKCIATTTVAIADVPAYLQFNEANAAIGTETNVVVKSADLKGNIAAIGAGYTVDEVNYVVVAKPEGATVSVDTAGLQGPDFKNKGTTAIKVACTKEGTVQVNVVAKASNNAQEVIYLTGTATVTFGAAPVDNGVSSTVTLIIGSNTFVANGSAYTSDVAPYVVNGRTFVPVRAFAEATGAKVEYDAATQVITITGEGITAQMTIGSNILTVNGETVVMDAAAAVTAEGRTVLPVRYAGQALGYDFECAYGSNGAVTSVTMFK